MLAELLQRADLWRGRQTALRTQHSVVATGFTVLDNRLPGCGWPIGALTEIFYPREGVGELQPILPALARLSQDERWIAWIAPPLIPFAPALTAHGLNLERILWVRTTHPKESLWALEQALRSGACAAVLGWLGHCNSRSLRRLQLAAEHGEALAFLYRPLESARNASPAALRVRLDPTPQGLNLTFVKCRGTWINDTLHLTASRTGDDCPWNSK